MNAVLPSGVESYLKEAGFSVTEILLLRKLVEEDSLTIRELASKTGKSTGVLDQAMKKLINKKIVQKHIINDQPRYSIHSLDAVLHWVKDDMNQRKNILDRRHENFESFIATLKVDKKRPDIEHYHGAEGIRQAYLKLLDSGKELLTLTPILTLTEADPLRLFRVDYFRKRQVRKIFQRILAPDTTLARRFQSKDPFEYRKTLLVPEADLPLSFEKTIVGDTIACFSLQEESACFLRYPDLAAAERASFESLWAKQLNPSHSGVPQPSYTTHISLQTRVLSSLREFVLSRRSLAFFAFFAILSGALTFGLYQNNRNLNLQRMRDKVMAIAATGALQFEAADIDAVHTPEDITKPEYAKLISTLSLIRRSNERVQYAYIMRPTDDPAKMTFVADADSLNPMMKKDLNRDGIISDADALNHPGEVYSDYQPYISNGLVEPIASEGTDQWGSFVSGHAPIRDHLGKAIAVLGVDIFAEELDKISAESFAPVYFFIGFFLIFLIIRYCALNKTLLGECAQVLKSKKRKVFLWTVFIFLLVVSLLYSFRAYTHHLLVRETGERLMAIAVTAASDFDPKDLDQLRFARDMKTEAYQRVFKRLNEIREKLPEITFAYIVRPTEDPDLFEFVADADSNFNLPLYSKYSLTDLGPFFESNENVWPGVINDDSLTNSFSPALKRPYFSGPSTDQWGAGITGCAPIFYGGKTIGLLCLDVNL